MVTLDYAKFYYCELALVTLDHPQVPSVALITLKYPQIPLVTLSFTLNDPWLPSVNHPWLPTTTLITLMYPSLASIPSCSLSYPKHPWLPLAQLATLFFQHVMCFSRKDKDPKCNLAHLNG